MLRYLVVCLAMFTLLPLSTGAARGQQAVADMERLALALLGEAREGELLVGVLPDGFPLEVLPADAEVLGTAIGRHSTEVAVLLPMRPSEADAHLRAMLEADGWELARVHGAYGFVDSRTTSREGPPIFCRDDEQMQLSLQSTRPGSLVRFHWRRGGQYAWCDGPALPPDFRLPPLTAPEGAVQHGTGGMAGGSVITLSGAVESTLSAARIADHYQGQLVADGWMPRSAADAGPIASREIELALDGGREWIGVISVTWIPVMERHDVHLTFMQPQALREEQERAPRRQ